jgi:hypothetical protein
VLNEQQPYLKSEISSGFLLATRPKTRGNEMNREPVASSNIATVGYDAASQTLEVGFLNGSVYQYYNIAEHLYAEFMRAPSKGEFLNTYIRSAYPYSRVG